MQNDLNLKSIGSLLENHAQKFSEKEAIVAVNLDSGTEQVISYNRFAKTPDF